MLDRIPKDNDSVYTFEKLNDQKPGYVLDMFIYATNNPHVLTDTDYFDLYDFHESVITMVRANPREFATAIINRLDFTDKINFEKTGTLLALLPDLVYGIEALEEESDYYDHEGNIVGDFSASEMIISVLQKAVTDKQGSYLLYSRASFLLSELTQPYFDEKSEVEFEDLQARDGAKKISNGFSMSHADARDFSFMMNTEMRSHIEKVFNIKLDALTDKEQFYFLTYLKTVFVETAELMQTFTSLYGIDGMRTFLSLEHGDESLGDKIIAFGQYEDVARHVFTYYGELLDSADNAEQLVHNLKKNEIDTEDVVAQVRDNILARAQKDLVQAVQSDDVESIRSKIDTYTASAKEYVALLQEVGEGKIERKTGGLLSNDDKTQMRTLLRANYRAAYPDSKDDLFRKAVADSLEEHMDDPNTTFRILYDGATMVSFNRFDTLSDSVDGRTVTYFGSFNAAASYSGVGGEMLTRTVEEQLQSGIPIMAHCDPSQKITQKYIESGFVAIHKYSLAGKESFEIWKSDDSTEKIQSKNISREELVAMIGAENSEGITVREQKLNDTYLELQQGKALTRFFISSGTTYIVFEELSTELQEEFTPVQEQRPVIAAE